MEISKFKIVVISMLKSKKRRAFMDLKLKSLGLKYEFFDAVDAASVKEKYKEYESWCDIEVKKPILGGLPSYACLISHCLFFQNSPPGNYFLLEDDVYFHRNFFEIMESLPNDTMDRHDILYMGYNNYDLSKNQKKAIENGDLLMPMDKQIMTFGGYGILYSAESMEYFKKIMKPDMTYEEVLPNDNIIWRHAAHVLRTSIVNPPLVIPEVRMSNIRQSRDMIDFCRHRKINMDDYMLLDKYETYAGLD
jgi:GR25 family glycosyltransferase involved in LPS biosynthesis